MNEEEFYQYQQMQQGQLTDAQLAREQLAQVQQAKLLESEQSNMAHEQLNIEEEIENLTNLLRGRVAMRNPEGELIWMEPKSKEEVLLTEDGINLIINTVRFYVNKNTLLANYDEDTILSKMEDLSTSLADALFMNYEKYFLYPTEKEVEDKLMERLKRRQKEMIDTFKLREEEYNESEIWKKLIYEIDPTKERQKIREQTIKNKLKGFDLLLRKVQDFIHSAYQRAWRGEERRTMRQHWHISETRNPPMPAMQHSGGGMFGWLKRK